MNEKMESNRRTALTKPSLNRSISMGLEQLQLHLTEFDLSMLKKKKKKVPKKGKSGTEDVIRN